MKPFREDMRQDLDKVERAWVRRPVCIILYPVLMLVSIPLALWHALLELKEQTRQWFSEVW